MNYFYKCLEILFFEYYILDLLYKSVSNIISLFKRYQFSKVLKSDKKVILELAAIDMAIKQPLLVEFED